MREIGLNSSNAADRDRLKRLANTHELVSARVLLRSQLPRHQLVSPVNGRRINPPMTNSIIEVKSKTGTLVAR